MREKATAQSVAEAEEVEYGPLGPGHAPAKDPLKGVRGVMSGTMMMESICFYLILTVILRVDNGIHWTPVNWGYITVVATAMLILSFLQFTRWAIAADVIIQVFALIGIFVHPSVAIIAFIFIAVWAYLFYLRKNLIERMKRGLLTTQHM
ncbi:DUF4233 domain-containing protein [Corynebacterium sp. sy017]|uniref:DUF4233 domain-containing protein n=1 Tax=unclassified Corynebacterium TaxID=2624378 RepID=UPI001186C53D|nr:MULTISPECIES: DUF4233 domain-containing protein [unclassified Corynebacterium]MBP3088128.1 DUF4233 domain-containing protein [Corynebacterium sp. sy017]QDZ43074.1 DUF4233 domain-containing protein [Corynebacterium sp. sy039]TSD92648.1 DUF4233 domain-containing protein [Corynebacterium sp. SY003]